ncbi:MAG TPA: SAM-dependent methyltransferase [Flavipsychrobacter sp.]|nr:SAM-dependent methyltransferase [Flavipsychrobacter sp.]
MEGTINNVQDTALWVAAFRARESDREDALFKDTLAKKLAGERGDKIVAATPRAFAKIMTFVMAIRTESIDRLIGIAIDKGIDTVVNLGAGLDTRPYRMKLPAQLKWIELDFPNIIDYKSEVLQNEQPVCKLQRIAVNLSDDVAREEVFAKINVESKKALVITEGVIPYLSNDEAAKLSHSIYQVPAFHFWIQDYRQGDGVRKRPRAVKEMLVNAPFKFTESNPLQFFGRDGWKVSENVYMIEEARKLGRKFPSVFPWNVLRFLFGKKMRKEMSEAFGYVMYSK